jgi:DNA-binding NarL/FixJ family response regulator
VIRVLILASSAAEEAALGALLAEDERLEMVEQEEGLSADVVLSSGARLPAGEVAHVPTVILTGDVFEPSDYGASDYRTAVRARLPSNATAGEVLAAIGAAAQGLSVLTQPQADALFAHPTVPQSPAPLLEELTPRELQVLRDVAQGWANKEIGEHLHISEHTVKFHVASILGKLEAGSRTEAVTQGIRRGLIPI